MFPIGERPKSAYHSPAVCRSVRIVKVSMGKCCTDEVRDMRCFSCGSELSVLKVEPQQLALNVKGFYRQTTECRNCGLVEERTTFSREGPSDEETAALPSSNSVAKLEASQYDDELREDLAIPEGGKEFGQLQASSSDKSDVSPNRGDETPYLFANQAGIDGSGEYIESIESPQALLERQPSELFDAASQDNINTVSSVAQAVSSSPAPAGPTATEDDADKERLRAMFRKVRVGIRRSPKNR